jgi:hypothetical protein
VHHRGRDDHVVAGTDLEGAERRFDHRRAVLDVEALVADRVPIERRRLVRDHIADPHVVVGQQRTTAQDRVGRARIQFVRTQMAWFQRQVRGLPDGRRLVHLGRDDRGRRVAVIEQRRVGREALLAHEFLGVQAAVGAPELSVPFVWHLADAAVVGHRCLPPGEI